MKITTRIKKIIFILLDQQDYITAQEISEKINVSARTILRELEGVERCLEEKNIVLEKKKGIGIKINIDSSEKVQDLRNWINKIKVPMNFISL